MLSKQAHPNQVVGFRCGWLEEVVVIRLLQYSANDSSTTVFESPDLLIGSSPGKCFNRLIFYGLGITPDSVEDVQL